MKEESVTDALVREFLLGKISDEERERIENLYLTDSQTRERVLTLEQDLIEDYLEDSLMPEDKARFLLRYAQTDEQRRKLRITRSIKDWAITGARAPQAAAATASVLDRLRARLRLNPVSVIPIAVIVVIVIVLAIIWLNSKMEQRKHLAVEQELAQLNSPTSLREVSPQISLDLRPVTVRSVEPQVEFNPRADIHLVELRLPWIQKERYSTYRAEVRGPGQSFTVPNLQAETNGEYVIRLRLLSRILHQGNYRIYLRGIANDGNTGLTEQYNFAVVR
jgi:hypothetical protein